MGMRDNLNLGYLVEAKEFDDLIPEERKEQYRENLEALDDCAVGNMLHLYWRKEFPMFSDVVVFLDDDILPSDEYDREVVYVVFDTDELFNLVCRKETKAMETFLQSPVAGPVAWSQWG